MVGGILTSFVLELIVYPPLYQAWKWHTDFQRQSAVFFRRVSP
jgi:Cu(I)/Ag(I) efflux system membrane protein CusA/SilA